MAGVSDKQMPTMRGWPAGIDNLSPEEDLVRDDQGKVVIGLRAAENVDLVGSGKPRRRAGRTLALAMSGTHSLWRDDRFPFALFAAGRTLQGFQPGGAFEITDGLTPGRPASYAFAAGRVYWSNEQQSGVVLPDGSPAQWGCPCPMGQPTLTAVAGQGGLGAGTYQVAITWSLASGEESGATLAAMVQVEEGGGIQIADMPVPPDEVARVRVYVSQTNGDQLYHQIDLDPALPVAVIGSGRHGKPLDSQFLESMPAGHIVRWFNGRLLVAADRTMLWSESLRYGLTNPTKNRIGFGARLGLMEPVGVGGDAAGVYVADAKRTYWLGGTDPARWTQVIAYPYGAVPGTGLSVPGSLFGLDSAAPVAYWLAANGVACLGLPGGTVLPLRERQAIAPVATSGASLLREQNGVRQVVTALQEASPRGLAMSDRAVTTVERYDS